MRQMKSRNTRPNATGGACSKSVSALTLCVRGDTENVRSWVIRVFGGDTTTPNGGRRKSGIGDGMRFAARKNYSPSKPCLVKDVREDAVGMWGCTAMV